MVINILNHVRIYIITKHLFMQPALIKSHAQGNSFVGLLQALTLKHYPRLYRYSKHEVTRLTGRQFTQWVSNKRVTWLNLVDAM